MNLRDLHSRRAGTMRGRQTDRSQLFGGGGFSRPANGYGHGASGSAGAAEHANAMLEAQNDAVIDQLFHTASQIKNYSHTINRQAKEQNELLSGMGSQMDKTQGLLGKTMGKMRAMAAQGGSKHMCYMVIFVVFILWLLYWTAFSKRTNIEMEVEQPTLLQDSLDSGSG